MLQGIWMDELPKKLMSQIGKLSTYIVLRRGFLFQQQVGWDFVGTIWTFPKLIFSGKWLKKVAGWWFLPAVFLFIEQ